jgi:hypothetical protein
LQLVSGQAQEDLPISDPDSTLWQEAPAVEVPLSAQNVSKPFLLDSKVKSITARALANQNQLAILVDGSTKPKIPARW